MGHYSGDGAMLYNEGTISSTLQNAGVATGAVAEIWNFGTLNIISNSDAEYAVVNHQLRHHYRQCCAG